MKAYYNRIPNQSEQNNEKELIEMFRESIIKIEAFCTLGHNLITIAKGTIDGMIFFINTKQMKHGIDNRKIRILIDVLENVYDLSNADDKKEFKLLAEYVKKLYKEDNR